ncbi:hypothetical protein NCCP2222_02580 [Sporosarcina sp. NCCP-2222]|nr:hypothetical protein NCCP2222_02580 [Sporosarcina sp. NCCP-2222]
MRGVETPAAARAAALGAAAAAAFAAPCAAVPADGIDWNPLYNFHIAGKF